MPDTNSASYALTERDNRKQLLKDEISKCMRKLEHDENNNPNNATTVSAKSEALLRPGPDVVQLSRGMLNKDIIQHQSAQDHYV